jgi:hypothetical protein
MKQPPNFCSIPKRQIARSNTQYASVARRRDSARSFRYDLVVDFGADILRKSICNRANRKLDGVHMRCVPEKRRVRLAAEVAA